MTQKMLSRNSQQCAKDCAECADACTRTAVHGLHLGGEHASPEHQTLMQDCADACAAAARFISRSSPNAVTLCRECAQVCLACAEECDRLANGDPLLKECAQACRKCAQSCEQLAKAGI